jgi:hypothetical protein
MKNNNTKNNVELKTLSDVQELINDILSEFGDGDPPRGLFMQP